MRTDYQQWHSSRLGRTFGVNVYGHWGAPLLFFPTSGGNEWEMQNQSLIGALADYIDGGRIKVFAVNANSGDSLYNRGAHPFHRSWMLRMYDEYIREEVVPFVYANCRSDWMPVAAVGMSLGAYYAVNALLKHPDVFKRCLALSGLYDMRGFMNGLYDENFYFNNPVDYVPNLSSPWHHEQFRSCDLRIITGNGPWERPQPSYHLAEVLRARGIPHSLDDWGALGGHDWPYWKHILRSYIERLYPA